MLSTDLAEFYTNYLTLKLLKVYMAPDMNSPY